MKETTKDIITNSGINMLTPEIEVNDIDKITKDMKKMILNIDKVSRENVKPLVTLFYQMQDIRIHTAEQIRSLEKSIAEEKTSTNNGVGNLIALNWILKQSAVTEKGISTILTQICKSDTVGSWLLSINGIGPALAAGCLSYFDIEDKEYASQFISYAGLNSNNRPWLGREKSTKILNDIIMETYGEISKKPVITDEMVELYAARTQWKFSYFVDNAFIKDKWNKDKLIAAAAKIPYNADLRTHMWKIGKSFEYLKTNKNSLYGRLLADRIALEMKRNEEGYYKEYVAKKLSEKNYDKSTETYKYYIEGKMSQPEINARCRRWVQKIFISHLFEEMYRVRYDKIPPRYYTLEHCEGHHKDIAPEVPYTKVSSELEN